MKEKDKFRLYQRTRDPKLREELVQLHRPLAEHIARQFVGIGEPLEDLVQVALIGLIKAIDRYDVDRGTAFTTFAWYHIKGEISHYLRDQGKLIGEPAWLQEARIRVERARQYLTQKLGREPTTEEIVQESRLTTEVVEKVQSTAGLFRVSSLEEVGSDEADESVSLETTVLDQHEMDAEQQFWIRRAVTRLPDLQRKIIELLFWRDLSQTEIAEILGVSVTYVSYLYKEARNNLRRLLSGQVVRPRERGRQRKKRKGEADEQK
ncbi:MAG: sigma-70 family RNA polymerase sigma factor [Armatimonadetes bacterium]|nr:sigma-70 family RNA polymerase sigma factor [Armatimonadota bacterium]MDW8120785.1 sigma-70 family RNA polymerase sigma factor [Armatimonadota bacterium]